MSAPIPVTIVTGFLGSGKTTLLRSLITRRQTRRLALLINEFGEVSIDGALIRQAGDGDEQIRIHDFPHGLIAYGDDALFVPTMQAIAARRANVDHVLIETSGLALPSAVMEILQRPALSADFILDAVLAVVDTPLLLAARDGAGTQSVDADEAAATLFVQQLTHADVVVLNKIDQLTEEQLLAAEQHVRCSAPQVRFLELAYDAKLDIRLALGLRLHQPTLMTHQHRYVPVASMPGPGATLLPQQERLNGHAHSGMGAHAHGLTTHKHFHEQDPGWLSFVLRSSAPQLGETLQKALVAIAKSEPLLRSKGFVHGDTGMAPLLVQAVRTRVIIGPSRDPRPALSSASTAHSASAAHSASPPAKPAPVSSNVPLPTASELVFIGFHLSRSRVASRLSELTGTHWR